MSAESLVLSDFIYDLPEERIAKFPLENRSDSKLLVFSEGKIDHHKFTDISGLIPNKCLLVFNDTKVIPARLIFHKDTGAKIEVFLLAPLLPSNVHEIAMSTKHQVTWQVMIGNSKRWKVDQVISLELKNFNISAKRTDHDQVTFSWEADLTFSEILAEIGNIPLPPYLGREATEEDKPRYQTVYSKTEGAVAAPTAGLHFTDEVINSLKKNGITTDYLTLHVSAGTFQPIKVANIEEHPMHREYVLISKGNVERLLSHDHVIPVGTTSMRTLESLFWFGQLLSKNTEADFAIKKDTPYLTQDILSKRNSLENVLNYMTNRGLEKLLGHTEIFIYPGYQFQICKGIITNFHQPGSTLMLLIAAMIGDAWKDVYETALKENYRFLSYGDSSLLLPKELV